jgi:hypothetical protein
MLLDDLALSHMLSYVIDVGCKMSTSASIPFHIQCFLDVLRMVNIFVSRLLTCSGVFTMTISYQTVESDKNTMPGLSRFEGCLTNDSMSGERL